MVNSTGEPVETVLTAPVACCKMDGDFPDVTPLSDQCATSPTVNISNYQNVSCQICISIAFLSMFIITNSKGATGCLGIAVANHIITRYALNNILFISDASSAKLALYLCE